MHRAIVVTALIRHSGGQVINRSAKVMYNKYNSVDVSGSGHISSKSANVRWIRNCSEHRDFTTSRLETQGKRQHTVYLNATFAQLGR